MTFTLTPGNVNHDQLIDISTHMRQALYDSGTTKLIDNESEKFDLKVTQVVKLQDMLGWTNLSQEITTHQVIVRNYDLISEYGQVP